MIFFIINIKNIIGLLQSELYSRKIKIIDLTVMVV